MAVACQYVYIGHRANVNSLAIATKEGCLLSASTDKTIRVWSLNTLKCVDVLKGHTGPIYALAYSSSEAGAYILSGGDDGIKVWKIGRASVSQKNSICIDTKRDQINIRCLCLTQDQEFLLSGSADGSLVIWRLGVAGRLNLQERFVKAHEGGVQSIACSRFPITYGRDNTVKVWSLDGTIKFRLLMTENATINSVVCIGTTHLAVATQGIIKFFDVRSTVKWRDWESTLRLTHIVDADTNTIIMHSGLTSDDSLVTACGNHIKLWSSTLEITKEIYGTERPYVTALQSGFVYFSHLLSPGSYLFASEGDQIRCYCTGSKEIGQRWIPEQS
mmetsp:Transcript_38329/g.62090  ORF Transcript_38329/g.62090 Transcript_38329/m.62090 type:complete len:331 (+) Transcript_38329:221-1213(+)